MTHTPTDADLQAKIAAMERELAELRKRQAVVVENTGDGVAFQGGHNLVVSGKVVGDVIQVYHAPPGKPRLSDDEVTRILGEYLNWVRLAHDQARLFGSGSASTLTAKPQSVRKLTEVFVPLTLRRFIPPRRQELEEDVARKAGLDYLLALRSNWNWRPSAVREVLPLADLLTISPIASRSWAAPAAARAPSWPPGRYPGPRRPDRRAVPVSPAR